MRRSSHCEGRCDISAGEVRGHASLMQPAKPLPRRAVRGVAAMRRPEREPTHLAAVSSEVASSNLLCTKSCTTFVALATVGILLLQRRGVKPNEGYVKFET